MDWPNAAAEKTTVPATKTAANIRVR